MRSIGSRKPADGREPHTTRQPGCSGVPTPGRSNSAPTPPRWRRHSRAAPARSDARGAALLSKADQVEAGPLNVTDQWVVLIDPVLASAEEMAVLQEFALQEQGEIIGAFGGPVAPLTVPLGAVILGGFGAVGGAEVGKFVGDVVCPY
ncbi:hypothetical protein Mvan_1063 [Mycolicibacterium vanbaalenii PYR-1]|uniref:Uncharacterized protein n=1 Tax=Mycolicibacterium vanbaalenii (strain DSM 7251 / JCM 13017 / BCRC 16820 / KCTC 9966 / NRRL B-24157 / PYR-1) TaxID=350058 RepID=A1T401_MYCVP|nr:hypothetical protein Mvan_1063 [Mycolicibacterium vanbaalenii PYR-1]